MEVPSSTASRLVKGAVIARPLLMWDYAYGLKMLWSSLGSVCARERCGDVSTTEVFGTLQLNVIICKKYLQ